MNLKNLFILDYLRLHIFKNLFEVKTIFIMICIFINAAATYAAPPKSSEVEAVFIYKFLQFIEWPEHKQDANFNICTLGEGEINDVIEIIDLKNMDGISVKVLKKIKNEERSKCRVIYIGEIEDKYEKETLKFSKENSILTISNKNGFLESGGIINFLIVDNRVNFEINFKEAKNSGLKISSKLLRTAKRVINN
ncbi:MAG: YfiR family protein [Thermodesulfobacteriota bacterium]